MNEEPMNRYMAALRAEADWLDRLIDALTHSLESKTTAAMKNPRLHDQFDYADAFDRIGAAYKRRGEVLRALAGL